MVCLYGISGISRLVCRIRGRSIPDKEVLRGLKTEVGFAVEFGWSAILWCCYSGSKILIEVLREYESGTFGFGTTLSSALSEID